MATKRKAPRKAPPAVKTQSGKPFWESKTLMGAAITVLAALGAIFGFDLSEVDQANLVDYLTAIGVAVGGILTVYGRITATEKIDVTP